MALVRHRMVILILNGTEVSWKPGDGYNLESVDMGQAGMFVTMKILSVCGGLHSTMDSILASHPTAQGLNPGVPKVNGRRCCLEQSGQQRVNNVD